MKKIACLSLIVFVIVNCFADGDLTGIWYDIGYSWEEFDGDEYYSGNQYLDTATYIMVVDSNSCKAYSFHEGRTYYKQSSYIKDDDSLSSESLDFKLRWSRRNDTLFISAYFSDGLEWEKDTVIFKLSQELRFPDYWAADTLWKPDELSPFGPWSFGTSSDIIVNTKRPIHKITQGITGKGKFFQLNGRAFKSNFESRSGIKVNNRKGKTILRGNGNHSQE